MGRLVSVTARVAANAQFTDALPVMLLTIRHPSLDSPVHLSSDPTVRLSADPLRYGTLYNGQSYDWVIMGAMVPDDQHDSPPKTTLVFENVSRDMAAPLRAIEPGTYASVDMMIGLVLPSASGPVVQFENLITDMCGVRGTYDAAQVTLVIGSREPMTSEPWPADRMTRDRFPGVHPA